MKKRKQCQYLLLIYSLFIIYCMFFAFNRLSGIDTYRFQLIPNKWPLRFPHILSIWLFDLGNIVAFIPFGVLLPKAFRLNFKTFIVSFLLMISSLELLQPLTKLGAFDVNDIVANTLGALIGYMIYQKSLNKRSMLVSLGIMLSSIIGIMMSSELGTHFFEQSPGDIQSLSNFNEQNQNLPQTNAFESLTVLTEEITPTLNLYSSEDGMEEFNYTFEKMKDVIFYANICMEDDLNEAGMVRISINQNVVYEANPTTAMLETIELPLPEVQEINIQISGDAKLWDVGLAQLKYRWE